MKYFLFFLAIVIAQKSNGQLIATFAGNGQAANTGDGGQAIAAATNYPVGVVFDKNNSFYFSLGNAGNKVRKVTPSGVITTIAGQGQQGYSGDGGLAINAKLKSPSGITVDSVGNVFIADGGNHAIRKVNISTGVISTVAGNGTQGSSGDGNLATNALLNFPSDVCFDKVGNLLIADAGNNRVRKIDNAGIITTFAGTGIPGHDGDGGLAINAKLTPSGLCMDDTGNIYIADAIVVRKVNSNGIITTFAGNGIGGSDGEGGLAINAKTNAFRITFDKKNEILYICENDNNQIRRVDKFGIITTVAGNSNEGFNGDGGVAINAELDDPFGICLDSCGNLYIADGDNKRVRKVTFNDSCGQLSASTINISAKQLINVFPNPAWSKIIVSTNLPTELDVMVINTLGQLVKQDKVNGKRFVIDISNLQPGFYFLSVAGVDGSRVTQKFLKL